MKHSALLAVSASLLLRVSASQLFLRTSNGKDGDVVDDGKAKVCYPTTVENGVVAPCVEIANIESVCQPNGTQPIDYAAHAQCMCHGSYFADWRACQNCLLVHGFRSERDNVYWDEVLSVASSAFCTGTPTAEFRSIFASANTNTKDAPPATSGDTKISDKFPDQTNISFYFTASGTQGPGAITGDAASATKKQQTSVATTSAVISTGANGSKVTVLSAIPSTGATTTAAATTRTSTGAAPAEATAMGLAMAIAGAALVAAF